MAREQIAGLPRAQTCLVGLIILPSPGSKQEQTSYPIADKTAEVLYLRVERADQMKPSYQ